MKKWILKTPSFEDLLLLLKAWRVWMIGAVTGAIIASIIYIFVPIPYRAQATVVVDQNVEEVIPEEQTDLLKDTYLARETEKIVDIAWSDETLHRVTDQTGIPAVLLRDGRLELSQPSDGGWHFLAVASDPSSASTLAASWAKAFVDEIHTRPAGISPLLEVNLTEQENLPVSKTLQPGFFVFCGSLAGITAFMLGLLLIDRKKA